MSAGQVADSRCREDGDQDSRTGCCYPTSIFTCPLFDFVLELGVTVYRKIGCDLVITWLHCYIGIIDFVLKIDDCDFVSELTSVSTYTYNCRWNWLWSRA